MEVEIRPAREDEMEQFLHVASNALVMKPSSFVGMRPEFTLCAFEDGRLATSYATWPLTMRFNGDGVPVAAVTTVGTLPIYRRRGYLRKITATHFEFLHEEGERPIAILWASWATIYQRYGYAVVSTQHFYNVEPQYLAFSSPQPVTGSFRELGDDEFPLLVDLYRKFRAERTGYLHRGREMWNANVLAPPPANGQLNKIIYEESGEPLGYVIYTVEPAQDGGRPGPSNRLVIRDLIWLTASAYRAIWSYFANMDVIGNIIWGRVPSDDPLPYLLLEPRMLRITSSDGILGRIVDVEQALPQRCYNEEGTLTFEIVDDDLCPWNCGRWRLEASVDKSSVSRTTDEPQLVMPISTLAMLLFGQISATEAARMGRLNVREDSTLPLWDAIMRTKYKTACADIF
jgi:predicted acetyltransferase